MSEQGNHFEDTFKLLPEKKLSWRADRRIRKMLKQKFDEMEGIRPRWFYFRKLAAVPVAMVFLLSSVGTWGFYSPGVVQGDMLYPVKTELEAVFYPKEGGSEERVAYHLWLIDRRYAELEEILSRIGVQSV